MNGGAIYITNSVSLLKSSLFLNITILFSYSPIAIIADNHNSGTLYITWLIMYNNSALNAAINGLYLQNDLFIVLNNALIYNSISDSSAFSFSSQTYGTIMFENVQISFSFESSGNPSDVIDLKNMQFSAFNLTAFNMSTLAFGSSSDIFITNGIFNNFMNGLVNINSGTSFSCNNCTVQFVTDEIITANTKAWFNLTNCLFSQNSMIMRSKPLIGIDTHSRNYIINCLFKDNYSNNSMLFNFDYPIITITNSTFQNNHAYNSDYSGMLLARATATITSCTFYNQSSSIHAAFIYLKLNSQATIKKTTFYNGTAKYGGAIAAEDSNLAISSSSFNGNCGNVSGGSIWSLNSLLTISSTTFMGGISPLGDAIYMENNNLTITSAKFLYSNTINLDFTASVYVIGQCNVNIAKSLFSSPTDYISGLMVTGAITVYISDTIFENITTDSIGSATFIGDGTNGNVTIYRSSFINNNSTGNGTGINLSDMNLILTNSTIANNHAGVDGGGLYLATPICKTCVFNITGNTSILNNTSNRNGGGIVWHDYKPNVDNSVLIINNNASYGNDFASSPANLVVEGPRMLISSNDTFLIDGAAPGQLFTGSYLIALVDTYNIMIETDSSSKLVIETTLDSPGLILRGQTSFIANNGIFNISNFIPNSEPGTSHYFYAKTSAISPHATRNDDNVYNDTILININLRECIYGEKISSEACTICPEGTFLINPDVQCLSCPNGGNCTGGNNIMVQAGYWRSSNMSKIMYPCPISLACLGSINATDISGSCAIGYTGPMCTACTAGYTKKNSGACSLCPSKSQNILFLFIIFVGILLICIIIVSSAIKTAFSPKSYQSIYLKIFTNYIQLIFLASQFQLQWPPYIEQLFGISQQANSSVDTIFSVDCYMSSTDISDPANSYYYKLILYALMPLIIFFVSFLFWIGYCFYKDSLEYLKDRFPLTMIVVFFLIYPTIVKFIFFYFSCGDIDTIGSFLEANTTINCLDTRYRQYAFIVAIPSILVWAVGLPTMVLIIMIKRKRFLYRSSNKIIFGFLYNGYKLSRFYWEFVIMYRKVIMVAIAVFLNRYSIAIQGLTIVLVVLIFLFSHHEFQPYNTFKFNHLELQALIIAAVTLYCGLYYTTNDIDSGLQLFLFIIIVAGNIYFCLSWLYWMIKSIIDLIAKSFPVLLCYWKKGDAYDDEFYSEELKIKGTIYDHDEKKRIEI